MNIYHAAQLLSFSIVHNNASVAAPKCKVAIYRKASSLSLIPFVPVAPLVVRPTTTVINCETPDWRHRLLPCPAAAVVC